MILHYSQHFHLSHDCFEAKGVYDGFIEKDSKLHIDPMLLKNCEVPEFRGAYTKFIDYFKSVVILSKHVKEYSEKDRFYKKVKQILTFKEVPNTGLGYSTIGNKGNGISGRITKQLTDSALEIIGAGIQDPEIFAIMHFIEEGIGADRISDMVLSVLYEDFLGYTERISSELSIDCRKMLYKDRAYWVPIYKKRPLVFIPCSLLCNLPIAYDFDDIDSVSDYNKRLRRKVSEAIGLSWRDVRGLKKHQLKSLLLHDLELFHDVISDYKTIQFKPYDFKNDTMGEYIDLRVEKHLEGVEPLDLTKVNGFASEKDVFEIAMRICEDFKFQIEEKGMWRLLYNEDNQTFQKEETIQLVFFLIAEFHCKANDIDLNRECDPGVGEIDIKLSQGNHAKTIIEIKRLSSNSFIHGLQEQLPLYMKSEQTRFGIYVVVIDSDRNVDKKLRKLYETRNNLSGDVPEIIFVDALPKKSASKK